MTVGEKIQLYRKKLGMSQEELGKKLLVTRQTVSLWETDQTAPSIEKLKILKDVFRVSMDELLSEDEETPENVNETSLDTVCAALAYAMGVAAPEQAAEPNPGLTAYIDEVFAGEKADRVVMYNPDAVAQWVYEKYPQFFKKVKENTDLEVPLRAAMPSVTPVCFGTMYTGAQPSVHGIRKYEKPVITIDTIFDSLVRAGKKAAIITYKACSLSRIFLGRNVDYYHFEEGDIAQVNAKAAEVILRDEHDFIVIYNGNYDSVMHKKGPESIEALGELAVNCHMFTCISELVKAHWKQHNTLLGFAMDHGCHEIDGDCGSHGLDMPEDLNITHFYKGYKAQ